MTSANETTISWDVRLLDWIASELSMRCLAQRIEVVTDLSKATLTAVTSGFATVNRTYLPEYDLENTDETRITILPITIQNDWITRKKCMDTIEVHFICQRRLPMDSSSNMRSEGDQLRTLLMSCHEYFSCNGIVDLADTYARWQPSRQPVVFVVDDVQEKHVLNCGLATFWMSMYDRCR